MAQQAVVDGRLVSGINTPGLSDTKLSQEELAVELGRSIDESAPGPNAFGTVWQPGEYTKQEDQTTEMIKETYGEQALKYTIIHFPDSDVLGADVGALTEENEAPSQLTQQCEGRHHVLNNRDDTNREQAIQVLRKTDEMVEENGGDFSTDDMSRDAEMMQREVRGKTDRWSCNDVCVMVLVVMLLLKMLLVVVLVAVFVPFVMDFNRRFGNWRFFTL